MPTDKLTEYALARGDLYVVILVLCFVIAGLVGAVVLQYRDGKKCRDARIEDAHSTIPVLESANKAMAAITAEMQSRTSMSASFGETLRTVLTASEKIDERLERLADLVRDSLPRGRP